MIIEQTTGVDVAVLDVGPDERGLTMRDPVRGTVVIGVARTRSQLRPAPSSAAAARPAITGYAEGVLPAQAIATLRGINL